ncbi:unnamed protein product [Kuraishia capsulata CBS 1993]|uniref:F-actin-capping protein subunit alpha n=1 Tax=Kuraishia capsulata CBS 1993 TaxID=1382522 RepID=W6MID3_9ASCO|nr:uncharacterized protein KUCA_T00000062001 [Kuraishia capsulata CBS 1993]CDK24102.1 unnamed protein product [Kuraishia capsulata CBS 1993]
MASVSAIISSMIKDSPPGDLASFKEDLHVILGESKVDNPEKIVSSSLEEYQLEEDFQLVPVKGTNELVSKYNKDGVKFSGDGVKFGYDFSKDKAIDIETAETESGLSSLAASFEEYVSSHFPSSYKSYVSRSSTGKIVLIAVDLKHNDANYYNGKWQSVYEFDETSGKLNGLIKVKIHYYEDGNVVLATKSQVSETTTLGNLVAKIQSVENDFELDILTKFSRLNENLFKNLRRQLPINRSKVQWGKSIKNYKLGQDVAGGRD